MIGSLQGVVLSKAKRTLVLEVGGVGYLVQPTAKTLKKLRVGAEATLLTYLAVREDALELFGFENSEELEYFHFLLSVPGIGPKSALSILSIATPEVLRRGVVSGDHSYLTRVSGIGKKSAEKIVLALKDKVAPSKNENEENLVAETEVLEALRALGYSLAEAREALQRVPENISGTQDRIKEALRNLAHG